MRVVKREHKTRYVKKITLMYDFTRDTNFFLKNRMNLSNMLTEMLAKELRKEKPFEGITGEFGPIKHFDHPLLEEGLKIMKLVQILCKNRQHVSVFDLWVHKDRLGFKEKDKEVMETALYNQIELGTINFIETEYPNGDKYYNVSPELKIKRLAFDKMKDRSYGKDLRQIEKSQVLKNQGRLLVNTKKIKL